MSTIAIKQISKDSSKRISKKDRKEQRAEFRVIEDFVVSCAYYEFVCEFFVVRCKSLVSRLLIATMDLIVNLFL